MEKRWAEDIVNDIVGTYDGRDLVRRSREDEHEFIEKYIKTKMLFFNERLQKSSFVWMPFIILIISIITIALNTFALSSTLSEIAIYVIILVLFVLVYVTYTLIRYAKKTFLQESEDEIILLALENYKFNKTLKEEI